MRWLERLAPMLAVVVLPLSPIDACAQSGPKAARIEFVVTDNEARAGPIVEAFRTGMREFGHVEGESYVLKMHYAEGQVDRIPQLVQSALERRPDVLVAGNFIAARVAKEATRTIPIVGASCGLEVLVDTLPRPGGNLTGVTCQSVDLAAKQLQLLREAVPSAQRLAVLSDPSSPYGHLTLSGLRAAAEQLGVQLIEVPVRHLSEYGGAMATIRGSGAQAVFIAPDTELFARRRELMLSLRTNRLPTIGFFRDFADVGALMSYSANRSERFHRLAWYADRILKGAKPGELPIDQPTRFELVINLGTARELGITLPSTLLLRADQLIQ
ncbi:MAG TPA: ABC transporter substrate-binding protein [Burkholderiaceae bacterium]|nr:ABC transporter substrate-binding protein [Burkholderiaceae bacterium]